MRTVLVVLAVFLLLAPSCANDFFPTIDIMRMNHWGELITIFSPHSFYFDGEGFDSPVTYTNGTAKIGSGV